VNSGEVSLPKFFTDGGGRRMLLGRALSIPVRCSFCQKQNPSCTFTRARLIMRNELCIDLSACAVSLRGREIVQIGRKDRRPSSI